MPLCIRGGVVCAGNMVYDVLVRPVDAVEWDTTTWVESIEPNLGGNGASTATALGILGVPVRLMAWTGRDAFGDFLLARLGSAGVDTTHVVRCDAPTATTIALVHGDGRRAFLHRPGASVVAFPESSALASDVISGAAHLHLANPYGVPNLRRHAARLLTDARAAGMTTSLDTAWDSRGEWMKVLAPCLAHIDLLFANEQEALRLTGAADYTQAGQRLREAGAATVVVKLGGAGCAVFTGESSFVEPAYAVEAIDTTGAGDCFAAGFLAALHHASGWRDAACFANAVGALNVQSLGATAGVLGYEETRAWVRRVPRR